jgi:formamidopyrimidine-DNA glycosylase
MSGSIGILEIDQPLKKHDHFDLIIDSNHIIRFNDPRRFGSFIWAGKKPEKHKLLSKLGPEPLENKSLGSYLHSLSKNRKTSLSIDMIEHKLLWLLVIFMHVQLKFYLPLVDSILTTKSQ